MYLGTLITIIFCLIFVVDSVDANGTVTIVGSDLFDIYDEPFNSSESGVFSTVASAHWLRVKPTAPTRPFDFYKTSFYKVRFWLCVRFNFCSLLSYRFLYEYLASLK